MTDEEMNQPCTRGDRCPQESFGIHSRVCKIEMETLNQRNPGQSWNDLVLASQVLCVQQKYLWLFGLFMNILVEDREIYGLRG